MDKNTLSNYGWIVAVILVLAIMITMATPFASVIKSGVETQVMKFKGTAGNALDNAGNASSFDDLGGGGSGSGGGTGGTGGGETPEPSGTPQTGDTWENGGYVYKYNYRYVYAKNLNDSDWVEDTSMNSWGVALKDLTNSPATEPLAIVSGVSTESLPTPAKGDTYRDEDYIYTYGKEYVYMSSNNATGWVQSYTDGWGVCVIDPRKTSYSAILSNIAGKAVTSLSYAFYNCSSLTTAPTIPSGITNMEGAFYKCASLTAAPTIPNSVTNMNSAFSNCYALTTATTIPSSVTEMSETFMNCEVLATAPTILGNVTDMSHAFYNCRALTVAPAIPDSVKILKGTFANCVRLTTVSALPSNATDIGAVFSGCKSLATAPVIPGDVEDISYAFYNCTALTGAVEINANPSSYGKCLSGTKITEITGSTTLKAEILATK